MLAVNRGSKREKARRVRKNVGKPNTGCKFNIQRKRESQTNMKPLVALPQYNIRQLGSTWHKTSGDPASSAVLMKKSSRINMNSEK